jgi:amino acid transporter
MSSTRDAHDEARELRVFGYEQQLSRSMGLFSSLSISISCMCITAGIFTVYAYALSTAGPAFVWTWPVVAAGQILVALVLAELAGRLPLSGYAFQWTSRLVNSHYGWFVGWAGLMAFIPGFTGLNLGLAPILSERLGLSQGKTSILVVVLVLAASQLAINLAGVKIAARFNNAAAFTAELAASIVLTLILLVVGFLTDRVNSVGFLTSSQGVPSGGFLTAFLLSGLLGIWVLTGFEGAADLAEETKLARKRVPRSVIWSLAISIVIGFFMIVALTMNISDLGATLAAPVPITHVLEDALGRGGALVFEWVAMVALFAGGLANMAAASRLMFSLSRDRMLPGSARLARVSPRTQSPSGSLITVAAISAVLVTVGTYMANEVMALIVGMASVGYYAVYALTIAAVLWAARNRRLSAETTFDLGRAAVPIRWAALVWSVFVVGVLVVPESNRKTAAMAAAFFAIAALWYFGKLRGDLDRGVAGVPASPAGAAAAPSAPAPSGQDVVTAPVVEEA